MRDAEKALAAAFASVSKEYEQLVEHAGGLLVSIEKMGDEKMSGEQALVAKMRECKFYPPSEDPSVPTKAPEGPIPFSTSLRVPVAAWWFADKALGKAQDAVFGGAAALQARVEVASSAQKLLPSCVSYTALLLLRCREQPPPLFLQPPPSPPLLLSSLSFQLHCPKATACRPGHPLCPSLKCAGAHERGLAARGAGGGGLHGGRDGGARGPGGGP